VSVPGHGEDEGPVLKKIHQSPRYFKCKLAYSESRNAYFLNTMTENLSAAEKFYTKSWSSLFGKCVCKIILLPGNKQNYRLPVLVYLWWMAEVFKRGFGFGFCSRFIESSRLAVHCEA
jgi:hypothetical protein